MLKSIVSACAEKCIKGKMILFSFLPIFHREKLVINDPGVIPTTKKHSIVNLNLFNDRQNEVEVEGERRIKCSRSFSQ